MEAGVQGKIKLLRRVTEAQVSDPPPKVLYDEQAQGTAISPDSYRDTVDYKKL